MQRLAQEDEELSEVNVIPLADLSLVLLIILMVISPLATNSLIQLMAKKAEAAQSQQDLSTPEVPVLISYEPNMLKLNGTAMGSELEFVKRLEEVMSKRQDKSVLFTAAPTMPHGKVVHVLDTIQHHGVTDLVMLKWEVSQQAVIPPPAPPPVLTHFGRGRS